MRYNYILKIIVLAMLLAIILCGCGLYSLKTWQPLMNM